MDGDTLYTALARMQDSGRLPRFHGLDFDLRDLFAAFCAAGIISGLEDGSFGDVAADAYSYADALLAHRERAAGGA